MKPYLGVLENLYEVGLADLKIKEKEVEEVELISYLVDGVNSALDEGSKELNSVIEKVNIIDREGTFRLSTFKTIDEGLEAGKELLKRGSQEKIAFRKKEADAIRELASCVKTFGLDIQEQVLLDGLQSENGENYKKLIKK